MSEKKGMIFDFNGTLVLDSHIHKAVWQDFFPEHGRPALTDEEAEKNLLGCSNTEILTRFFSPLRKLKGSPMKRKRSTAAALSLILPSFSFPESRNFLIISRQRGIP